MPGVGDEQRGVQPPGGRQHIAKQPLFDHQRRQRHPQRHAVHRRNRLRLREMTRCRPQHTDPDQRQDRAEDQRGAVLIAPVAIMVIVVRGPATLFIRHQHNAIGEQIGKRVHSIGN